MFSLGVCGAACCAPTHSVGNLELAWLVIESESGGKTAALQKNQEPM